VDDPMRSTRPGDADAADRSASEDEAEWRAGLDQLLADLDDALERTVETARRQVRDVVRTIEERGKQQLESLAASRQAYEADQAALSERVAAVQADIEAVEDELNQARAQADQESEDAIAAARRRADAIVADAEARAAEIVAAARSRAGSGDVEAPSRSMTTSDAGGRLRGLSERVGRLVSTPGAAAAGAGLASAGRASAAPPSPPEAPAPPRAEPTPPVEPRRWSVVESADDDQAEPDEADTEASPAASVWLPPAEGRDMGDQRPSYQEPEQEPEPDYHEAPTQFDTPSATVRAEEPAVSPRPPAPPVTQAPTSQAAPPPAAAAQATAPAAETEQEGAGPAGAVTQTLIFQSVPNFQAALALERSLKAMSEVREVRVADFDERQLTFQVTHELGGQLPRVLLTQRGSELELVEARAERVEFVFRS
jgi:hypothetical protein